MIITSELIHHTMIFPKSIVASILVLSAGSTASAATAVSNLGEPTNGGTAFQASVATSFTTGSALPLWSLESVEIPFSRDAGNSADSITVAIHADTNGVPGGTVVPLSGDPITNPGTVITNPGTYNFYPNSPTNLAASTTYWIVLSQGTVIGDTTRWDFTNSDAESSAFAGWSIGDDLYENIGGWTNVGPNTGQLAINAVPEPSGALLAGLGALALLGRRRRC